LPAALLVLLLFMLKGETFRITGPVYWVWAGAMAATQVAANILLVALFRRKNFAVSVSLIKSEAVMLAFLCVPLLGERIGGLEWAGIGVATAGIMAAVAGKNPREEKAPFFKSIFSLNTLMALTAGFCLALATIFLKMSYRHLESDTRSGEVILSVVIILGLQSLMLVVPVLARNRSDLAAMVKKPLVPFLTGMASAAGTFCWFTAFALVPVSWVRTVGQSEFIIAGFVSALFFKEKLKGIEIAGMVAVAAGTLMIVLSNGV
jgi:drug/metabolite transporter (DMT)-like permease